MKMKRLTPLMSTPALALTLASSLVATAGCNDAAPANDEVGSETDTGDDYGDGDGDGIEEPAPEVAWPTLECDPLVPEYCMFPYPSNVFTAADDASVTGRRLALTTSSLPSKNGNPVEAAPFNEADGFSPGLAMLTNLEGATTTGLPSWTDIQASLADDSPTVLLNTTTGERVAHFAEIDASLPGPSANALMIRPAVRLDDNTRYIVAIRSVVNAAGEVIPASSGFAALRDLVATDDESIDARRPLYADIFQRLGEIGVERETLQIAWDFTTASLESTTGDLLHMRDDALSMYPVDMPSIGPSYTITEVEEGWDPNIAFKIQGLIEVPLYLDDPGPGGHIVYGDDGLPEMQGTAEYPFYMMIPNSAIDQPAPLLQYGHGLLGSADELYTSHMRSFINENNYILFGVNWIGMSEEDALGIAAMLNSGEMHKFEDVSDRLQQGMVNFVVATRMMKTSFAEDPVYGSYIDPSNAYYLGISQGGIFGGTFMAITQDIERGCMGVFGQPYNILLNRSVDFNQYFAILQQGFTDSRDLQILLALIQGLWDTSEPTGYAHKISKNMFPNTPEHSVLMRAAVGDHQVTTLGAHIGARAVGATHLDTGIREVWGLDSVTGQNTGSTYVEYEFGLPMDPIQNIPQEACEDPHGKLRKLDEARMQLHSFFQTGVVENVCADQVCSFPDLSGC